MKTRLKVQQNQNVGAPIHIKVKVKKKLKVKENLSNMFRLIHFCRFLGVGRWGTRGWAISVN